MNKVSRLLGSATLATCLAVGGTAGAASANDYRDNNNSHSNYDKDRRDRDERDRRDRDSKRHDNDYKYLYRCSWRGHHWYEWSNRYEHRRNCDFVVKVKVRY